MCKSCRTTTANKSPIRNQKRENNPAWKGYKDIPYNWFSNYFKRSGKFGDITIEQVYDLWIAQDKKCALSGVSIGFYDDGKTHTCSIDRIDSSGGYTLANIQLVHKDVNIMKNKFDNQYFIDICKEICIFQVKLETENSKIPLHQQGLDIFDIIDAGGACEIN